MCRSKGEFTKERIQAEAGRQPAGLMGGTSSVAPRPVGSETQRVDKPDTNTTITGPPGGLCVHTHESDVVNIGIGVGVILPVVPGG